MANGGTLTELVTEGRGKLTILSTVVIAMAAGMGWWFSQEGRDAVTELRRELRAEIAQERIEMRSFVVQALAANQGQSNDRMSVITDTFERIDRELQARVTRPEFEYRVRDVDRRLSTLERTVDFLRGSPRSPGDYR